MTEPVAVNRLTDAATQLLESATDEWRTRVLLRAEELAEARSSFNAVDTIDVARAIAEGIEQPAPRPRTTMTALVLRLYAAVGLLVAAVALGYLALQLTAPLLGSGQRLLLTAAAAGFAVAIVSAVAGAVLVQATRSRTARLIEGARTLATQGTRDERQSVNQLEFIRSWLELEGALRNLAATSGIDVGIGISALIRELERKGVVTRDDAQRLRGLARLRNGLVHGDYAPNVRDGDLADLFRFTSELAKRVQR